MDAPIEVESPAPPPVEARDGFDEQAERGLLLRIAARDRRAMEEFYLLYHTRVQRLLRRITLQRERVEEMVDNTFMAIWNKANEFQGEARVCTWCSQSLTGAG